MRTARDERLLLIIDALRKMAPGFVRVGARAITLADEALLHESERAAVAGSVAKRRSEFASGRVLLRELLGTTQAILPRPDRSPGLPPGTSGSLAHDDQFVVAAVSCEMELAIGIDIEPSTALGPDVADLILRSDEQGLDAHLAFCLKESTYKAWNSSGGRILEHKDVRVRIHQSCFDAVVLPEGIRFVGEFSRTADRWLSLVVGDR